jgi:cytochrome c biogenesis factor
VQQFKTAMLQRIQSIYLLIAVIASGILPLFLPLYTLDNGDVVSFMDNIAYVLLFVFSATLSIVGIFTYKKRKNQFVLGRLNIILNLILLGLFIYRSLNLSGEANVSEKGIGMFLPIVSIVFISLANKAIKKDEDLVKSADRLR